MELQLPNGCSSSNLSVSPKNWHTKSGKISQDWLISYRFYHPNYANPKQVIIKGMNYYKTLEERQRKTNKLIDEEFKRLGMGYNPFQKAINQQAKDNGDLNMLIVPALKLACEEVTVTKTTKRDL